MRKNQNLGSIVFDTLNFVLLGLYAFICIIPFIHIIAGSLATASEMLQKKFILFPSEFSLEAYRYIFSSGKIIRSLGVTIYLTVAGTILNVIFTAMLAYPLAKKTLKGRQFVLLAVLFTMLFDGGMIPQYILV